MLDKLKEAQIIQAALESRNFAYAPYSRFLVGAALLTVDNDIVRGCNVENASYGATICAERTAAVSAIAAGKRDWVAIAVATEGGVSPCGVCRQFLAEFSSDLIVLMFDAATGECKQETIANLLPHQFHLKS